MRDLLPDYITCCVPEKVILGTFSSTCVPEMSILGIFSPTCVPRKVILGTFIWQKKPTLLFPRFYPP